MGLAAVALVLLVAYVAYRVARHRRDARLRSSLDTALRVLRTHLGREWRLVAREGLCLVFKNGERVTRIDVRAAIEQLDGAAPDELSERVQRLVTQSETVASSSDA